MEKEPEPIHFLATTAVEKDYSIRQKVRGGFNYPTVQIDFMMNTRKVTQSRKAYTFFDLISDFGGFNDAIFLVFGTLMGFYSSHAYQVETTKDFKVRDAKASPQDDKTEELISRINCRSRFVLGPVDLRTMHKAFLQADWFKPSFYRTNLPSLCLPNKHDRVQRHLARQVENSLDVRNIFRVRADLGLLTRLVLNKQ